MISKVVIPVATAGIEAEGTAYRMDGIPLRLSKLVEPHDGVVSDKEVLDMIIERVRKLKEG
jgi:formylmethanofuran dehydrogenase subunit B